MKRLMIMLVVLMFVMMVPVVAMASSCCPTTKPDQKQTAMNHMKHESQEHGKSQENMHQGHTMENHGDMAHDDHGKHAGHDMHGGMAEIGQSTEDGVTASAKVMVYDAAAREAMAKAGQNATHHLMIYFADAKTGKAISTGQAAVKVKSHGGESSKPIALMQMGAGFGADVNLPGGHYEIEVGTKLEDGKKRKFEYDYMTK